MNVLFVTVGTSALTNPGIGKAPNGRDNSALQLDMQRFKETRNKPSFSPESLKKDDFGRWTKLYRDLVGAHQAHWGNTEETYRSNPLKASQTAAELTTTHCLVRDVGREFPFDKIVLLPTETADGQMASRVVLAVMRSAEFGLELNPDRIVEEPIPGLEKEIGKLADGLRAAISTHSPFANDRRFVNVTGGFKGTSLMLGRLSKEGRYRIYYQHETLDAAVYMRDERTSGNWDVWRD